MISCTLVRLQPREDELNSDALDLCIQINKTFVNYNGFLFKLVNLIVINSPL